jgi:ubiquinone/menaquinone biosynthesis C-methylase UbiE
MKKNQVLVFKVFLFRVFKPLERVFAYNRKRRDKWMIKQANNIPNGSKVLDVGAGGCPHRKLFSHCEYFSQDFVQLSGVQIQNQLGYGKIDFVSDILNIPVPDKSYDVILCTEVIEHIPDPISAIKEISRILKPGGTLLITAPLQSGLHQEPYHFYGGYTKYWYQKFLTENNFSDINIEPNGSLYTTYFSLGLTIIKSFLEVMVEDKNLLRKLIAFISFIIFSPILLILNPIFCFLWESIYQQKGFTAGYHVSAKKSL